MKNFVVLLLFIFISCKPVLNLTSEKEIINASLNNWHKAAADAEFDNYFNFLTDDAIYIGTDANENWTKDEFKAFSKPYFDKGKAWSFTALNRNIYFAQDGQTAWFNELLNTQMKICQGSGVLEKHNGSWKIKHYVLSMTIPNENSEEIVKMKTTVENILIKKLQSK